MKRLAKLLIILTLCSAVSLAQGRRGGARGGGARGGGRSGPVQMDERTALVLISALLSLSDSQRQQLTTIFDAAAQTAAPIATQMEAGKGALFEAVKSGKSDDQIKTLAEQQGSLTSRMLALQAQTFSKMWALLESDQKSKVDASIYGYIEDFLSSAGQPAPPAPAVEPPGR